MDEVDIPQVYTIEDAQESELETGKQLACKVRRAITVNICFLLSLLLYICIIIWHMIMSLLVATGYASINQNSVTSVVAVFLPSFAGL